MRKAWIALLLLFLLLLVSPAAATVPGQDNALENPAAATKGVKRLTPVLDLVGDELAKVGTKLVDSAVYSLEKLWRDTLTWNITQKEKI